MGKADYLQLPPSTGKRPDWLSLGQWECVEMLADVFGGFHHLHGRLRKWGDGVALTSRAHIGLATFDGSALTDMVLLAHERMIRVEIDPGGPGMLRIILHKRHKREGQYWERHPTIQQAIALREKHSRNYPCDAVEIPPMVDPRGAFWVQPSPSEFAIGECAITTLPTFKKLNEYSSTVPTGVYPGKMWKRRERGDVWYLCWYAESESEGYCDIRRKRLLVLS